MSPVLKAGGVAGATDRASGERAATVLDSRSKPFCVERSPKILAIIVIAVSGKECVIRSVHIPFVLFSPSFWSPLFRLIVVRCGFGLQIFRRRLCGRHVDYLKRRALKNCRRTIPVFTALLSMEGE
jgi:hypothetical protein